MKFIRNRLTSNFFSNCDESITGNDIFSITTTGITYYDVLLKKGLENVSIRYFTPTQYLKEYAKLSNSRFDKLFLQLKNNKYTHTYLSKVLLKDNKKFPMPILDYVQHKQEGKHRMFTAGSLFGWNKKYPVLIVKN